MRWVVGLLLLAGCGATGSLLLPAMLREPSAHDGADGVWMARRLFERGEPRRALAAVGEVLERHPDAVDAARLRQDILRARGRFGLVRWEAEQRLAAAPASAAAHYLSGRLQPADSAKRAAFARATALDPHSFWGWLGSAYSLRGEDLSAALTTYSWLWHRSEQHPLAAVAFAAALREGNQLDDAVAVYTALCGDDRNPGVGELGLAEVYTARDQLDLAWPMLLSAIELRPFDGGVGRLLSQYVSRGLPEHRLEELVSTVRREPARQAALSRGGGALPVAQLFAAAGDPPAALEVLGGDPHSRSVPGARRLWWQLLLARGDVAGYLQDLRDWLPLWLIDDERNQLRGRWRALLDGAWMTAEAPLGDASEAARLVRALLDVGLLEAAERIGTLAIAAHSSASRGARATLEQVRAEASRERAFEGAVRRTLYRGYAAVEPRGLDAVLQELRRHSQKILGVDVVGRPERFELPFVGELLDPFAEGLCAHFAKYNRHLVLGERQGRSAEGLMLVRLSMTELPPDSDLPLEGRALEVVGEDRRIRSLSGAYGGDLAGVALLNHYVVDMDSVREWAEELLERRRIARADRSAIADDPLPDSVDTLDPVGVHWRLGLQSPVEDEGLQAAVLDVIRWHERAHLVDVFHYLPLEANLGRIAGLLVENGFSAASVEAELEARAETAALALSAHPRLVLAHLAVFLEGQSTTPHGVGFRRASRRLAEAMAARGLDSRASRWHRADPEEIRQIARELLARQW